MGPADQRGHLTEKPVLRTQRIYVGLCGFKLGKIGYSRDVTNNMLIWVCLENSKTG